MQITVVKVSQPEKVPGQRPYSKIEVLYQNEQGEQRTKPLVSFSNPGVYKALVTAQPGDVFEIKTFKNTKGYFDWVNATLVENNEASGGEDEPVKTERKPAPAVKITFTEADRNRSIVRQTALKAAVEFLKDRRSEDGSGAMLGDVVIFAQAFEDYVNRPADSRIQPPQSAQANREAEKEAPAPRQRVRRRQVVEAAPSIIDSEEVE